MNKAEKWDRELQALAELGYRWGACPACADEALTMLRAARYPEAEELLDKALRLHVHITSGPRQTGKSPIPQVQQ